MADAQGVALLERWGSDSLGRLLVDRVEQPDLGRVVGFYDRAARSFRETSQRGFLLRALAFGATLSDHGVERGRPVIVAAAAPEHALHAYLGAIGAGALPVIMPIRPGLAGGSALSDTLHRVSTTLGGSPIVLRPVGAAHPLVDHRVVEFDLAATELDLRRDLLHELRAGPPDAVAHIQLTSGSTGEQRAIGVTHANLAANCRAIAERFDMTEDEGIVSWLPLSHDMGLVGMALLSLFQGTDLWLLSPFDFLSDPANWLRAITLTRASIAASPTFGYAHTLRRVDDSLLAELDLSSWRLACCGAEPIDAATLRSFAHRFGPVGFDARAFTPSYGLAEATLAVTVRRRTEPARTMKLAKSALARLDDLVPGVVAPLEEGQVGPDEIELTSCGPPVEGLELRVCDPDTGDVVRPGRCGEVQVRAASVCSGYVGTHAGPLDLQDGWLCTGDLGLMHEGELYVLERLRNIVIRNGNNVGVQLVESALAREIGASPHEVAVFDASLHDPDAGVVAVLALDAKIDAHTTIDRARRVIADEGLPVDTVLVVKSGSMPRTTSGKKRHVELRRAFAAGELAARAVASWTEPASGRVAPPSGGDVAALVYDTVGRIATRAVTEVAASARFLEDLGIDSVDMFEVIVALEEEFGIAVPEERLDRLVTVGDLVGVVDLLLRSPDVVQGEGGLARLRRSVLDEIPQIGRIVDEQVGRRVRIDGRWFCDLASLNYLGLDLHPTVIASVAPFIQEWGVHPSWSRAVASPRPYADLEAGLAALVGAPDTLVFPTITLLHLGVLPALVGRGVLIVDRAAHHSIHEAADVARARGARVVIARHGDLDDVERALRSATAGPSIVAIDGVYSMTGDIADLAAYLALAERYDALLYVDDAHGLGVLGRNPSPVDVYGTGGGGVALHQGVDSEKLVYVSGLSKSFSSLGAFVACRTPEIRRRLETASTMVFSGPIPGASLASALSGLEVNALEGDRLRSRLYRLTARLVDGCRALGVLRGPHSGFPIVPVTLGTTDQVVRACQVLWERGVLVTPSLFPAVAIDQGGLRFSVTAANTDDDIDVALEALAAVRSRSI